MTDMDRVVLLHDDEAAIRLLDGPANSPKFWKDKTMNRWRELWASAKQHRQNPSLIVAAGMLTGGEIDRMTPGVLATRIGFAALLTPPILAPGSWIVDPRPAYRFLHNARLLWGASLTFNDPSVAVATTAGTPDSVAPSREPQSSILDKLKSGGKSAAAALVALNRWRILKFTLPATVAAGSLFAAAIIATRKPRP